MLGRHRALAGHDGGLGTESRVPESDIGAGPRANRLHGCANGRCRTGRFGERIEQVLEHDQSWLQLAVGRSREFAGLGRAHGKTRIEMRDAMTGRGNRLLSRL